MKFNKSKCFIMHMTHKRKPISYSYLMGDSILQEVKHHPYLGVELSHDLSWTKHISQTVNSANKVLGLLKRNLWNCSPSTKELAYKTLVRPKLEYASSVWDPHFTTQIDFIENVQRRAARFVKNDYGHTSSVKAMLKDLNWDKLEVRRTKARLITLFKESHGFTPSNISHLQIVSSIHRTRSDHALNYKILSTHKDCYKYSLYPRTIPLWNKLPPELKTAPSVLSFKQQLEKYI